MRPRRIDRPARPGLAWLIGLTGFALLAGCDRPTATSGPTPISTSAVTSSARPAPPSETATEVSSNADSEAQTPGVNPSPEEMIARQRLQAHWANLEEGKIIKHRLLARLELPDASSGDHFILSYASRTPGDTCSACAPSLSFFEFRRDTDDIPPRLLRAYVAALELGYAGQAPRPRLQMLGRHRYAITFFWATYGMGVHPQLTVVMPIKGRMQEVFNETIGGQHDVHSDENGFEFVYWKSFHSFQPGPGPYLDLHIERHFLENQRWLRDDRYGEFRSEPRINGQVPMRLIYRFDGQHYRRVIADLQSPRKHYACWKDSDDYDERID